MKEPIIRIALIAGACLCLVIGVKWIAEDIVYQIQPDITLIIINGVAFAPMIALAPRYKNGKMIYYWIGWIEAFIIWLGIMLRPR